MYAGAGCRGEAALFVVPVAPFLGDTSQKQASKAKGRENAATCPDQRDLKKHVEPKHGRPCQDCDVS